MYHVFFYFCDLSVTIRKRMKIWLQTLLNVTQLLKNLAHYSRCEACSTILKYARSRLLILKMFL